MGKQDAMITTTMTEKELVVEVTTDYLNAFRYSDHLDKKFRRVVIKARQFPVRMCYEYCSPRKNKWLIFCESRSKKEVLDNSRITLVAIFDTSIGIHAVMGTFTGGKMHFVMYPPHFFSRYRQRSFINMTGIPLIKRFFSHNYNYVYDINIVTLSENTMQTEVHGSTADGVALGYKTAEENVLFKTFVTYDMLKGEQIAIFTANDKIRREIHG